MADISFRDKEKLEKIFGMKSGYVIDFYDNSFQRFFNDTAKINITDSKYQKYGTSKANRLRAFWDIESNIIVGKILEDLLFYYKESMAGKINDEELFKQCSLIAENLQNKKISKRIIDNNERDIKHIWGEISNFKIFLSHKAEFKKEALKLKDNIKKYGISCFVAHVDIEPTKEWQDEIEKALFSADALIALLTMDFHNSKWTDQEIGIAFGRGIPIIPIKCGSIPYGFIGKFQALSCNIDTEFKKIISLLLKNNSKMVDLYIQLINDSKGFDRSMDLSWFLEDIDKINDDQEHKLLEIYKNNSQVNACYGFIGSEKKPYSYGKGLFFHLNRITGKDYSKIKSEIEKYWKNMD